MGYKPKPKNPQFADLKGILSQSKQTDNALYQTVQVLIERLTQFQGITVGELASINSSISSITASGGTGGGGGSTTPPSIVVEGYWTMLTDGDIDETELIFADGNCIAVFVPTSES